MNVTEYTHLINKPDAIHEKQTEVLEKIVQEFPYFQSARALYLKGLYNQNSFKYNYALKIAAAHTTDRSVLFDFITSDTFTTLQKSLYDQKATEVLNISVVESETVSEEPRLEIRENTVEQSLLTSIKEAEPPTIVLEVPGITIDDFVEVPQAEETAATEEMVEAIAEEKNEPVETIATAEVEEKLEIGKPLAFSLSERHSFQEWLQLSKIQPIVREEETAPEPTSEVNFEKQKKNVLIDKFIEANPKIPAVKKDSEIPSIFPEAGHRFKAPHRMDRDWHYIDFDFSGDHEVTQEKNS
jgi:hypothetical protein